MGEIWEDRGHFCKLKWGLALEIVDGMDRKGVVIVGRGLLNPLLTMLLAFQTCSWSQLLLTLALRFICLFR